MNLVLHPLVDGDLEEAAEFYEQRGPGLAHLFLMEVKAAFERIEQRPHAWPRIEGPVRRCRLNTFPFGVYYRVDAEMPVVLAVLHGRRLPEAWRGRS